MVERNRGDGGHDRIDHVRCIQAAAKTDFDDRDVNHGAAEKLESHRRRHLEKGRVCLQPSLGQQCLDGCADIGNGGNHAVFGDGLPVNHESFGKVHRCGERSRCRRGA